MVRLKIEKLFFLWQIIFLRTNFIIALNMSLMTHTHNLHKVWNTILQARTMQTEKKKNIKKLFLFSN